MHYQTFWHDEYEYRSDIMEAIVARLNAMVHHFARVFVVRLDITFPAAYRSTRTSEEISKLMKRLVEIGSSLFQVGELARTSPAMR
jgi:energy-converting hydrogenase A subunit M